jgi:hypothetical protein
MLNCIGPGIRRLAMLEGCDIDTVDFVPCITYEGKHKSLSVQLLSTLSGHDNYNELTEYINKTCRGLKA